MPASRPAIWIQPASPPPPTSAEGACGGCGSETSPGRFAEIPSDGPGPVLSGDADQLRRVMAALRGVRELHGPGNIVESGRVQALAIEDGEATLTLRMGQGLCADAHALAEMAFEALRQTLPDTDLYLRHDRPLGCAGREQALSA